MCMVENLKTQNKSFTKFFSVLLTVIFVWIQSFSILVYTLLCRFFVTITMPWNPRKNPSGYRKKCTASAHDRVSTKKIRKKNQNQGSSFLQTGIVRIVSTSSPQTGLSSTALQGTNDIMYCLFTSFQVI